MRPRFVLLLVAILLIAGFAALNWSEVNRQSPLLFGPIVMEAPLGAILLSLLALAVVVFALSAASLRTTTLLESRNHHKQLEAQRALADKAEASRFTELREHFDTHLNGLRERDTIAASELEKSRLEHQRELRTQLEQINRTLSARLNEMEHRLETRFERMGYGGSAVPVVNPAPLRAEGELLREPHAIARNEEARQAEMRDEERLRDERIRAEREVHREERAKAEDRPAESGWRRWF
jgi:uncharacterized integral membrane protein